MRKNIWKLFSLILGGMLYSTAAFAADDIFGELALRAEVIGGGLTSVGYVIAAIGLIVFTFMAIFNKLSWKTLAYIMMSCFFLSVMGAIISWIREDGDQALNVSTASASGTEKITTESQDPTKNPASKGNTTGGSSGK